MKMLKLKILNYSSNKRKNRKEDKSISVLPNKMIFEKQKK